MFKASAEGASEKFRVFCMGTAYDVIIFKFQGGGIRPPAPPADAHASELGLVYEWDQQSSTPAQNGAQSHKFIDQVMHVPI